ncbi:MAG TPA: response regulator [Labilithrix sp.]|jgi:CheY-like chemotaxis protein|nr:response regulator [Labilithrix sp.]
MDDRPRHVNPRILIVDDDPDILEVMSIILSSSDFDTMTAKGGVEALHRLHDGPRPQLIILDMMMPEMNGWAFRAEQLKDPSLADIPVILLTADGHASDKAKTIGAVACLKKPLEMEELLSTVARHCTH